MNNKELEQAMNAFAKAAFELCDAWDRNDHTGDYLTGGYPFTKAFGEVCDEIMNWRDQNFKHEEAGGGFLLWDTRCAECGHNRDAHRAANTVDPELLCVMCTCGNFVEKDQGK